MEDTEITCAACGSAFVFTASEQAYYAERGFQFPKRCRPCRQARRKGGRGAGGAAGGNRGNTGTSSISAATARQIAPRKTHLVNCGECLADMHVVFPLDGERKAYCPACFSKRHSG